MQDLVYSNVPSIDINLDAQRTARIELSLKASDALVGYIRTIQDLNGIMKISN